MEYNFVTEPDDVLKCAICLEVARDPHEHEECGRLFCEECIEKYGIDKPCPHCRVQGSQYFKDNRSKRDIQDIPVCCDNNVRGCKWNGALGTLEEHMATCGFTLVPCPKECQDEDGAPRNLLRKEVASHLEQDCPNRDYGCEYCGGKGTFQYITEVHDDECERKVVPCPNDGCCEVMPREDWYDHNCQCEYAIISCKYKDIGCETKVERRHMTIHQRDNMLHLQTALVAVTKLRGIVEDLEDRLEYIEHHQLHIDSIRTFALHGYANKKKNNEMFSSPLFYTRSNRYNLNVAVYANGSDGEGTHVSVYAFILCDGKECNLEGSFPGRVLVSLLNQLEDRNHHTRSVGVHWGKSLTGSIWDSEKFAPHSILLYNVDRNTQYLKDDTLYFRVSVEEGPRPWLECT